MTTLITLSDLNTTINHEPRVRDLTLAERLGLANQRSIREMIETNRAELETYGVLSAVPTNTPDPQGRGRPGTEYWLNEAQALLLCTFSRTAKAAEVRRALISVFMAFRRGQLAPPPEPLVEVKGYRRRLRIPERVEIRYTDAPDSERGLAILEGMWAMMEHVRQIPSFPAFRRSFLMAARMLSKDMQSDPIVAGGAACSVALMDEGAFPKPLSPPAKRNLESRQKTGTAPRPFARMPKEERP